MYTPPAKPRHAPFEAGEQPPTGAGLLLTTIVPPQANAAGHEALEEVDQ